MEKKENSVLCQDDIFNYRRIRKVIGYLGFSLPVALVLLSLLPFFKTGIQDSISSYYYTNFREIFTGILCAVSLFLICYKGTRNRIIWRNDSLLTNIAGIMALLIAFFPTNPLSWDEKIYTIAPWDLQWLGWLHYFFAATFFLILANISINVFTIGQQANTDIPVSMLNENYIYRICGWTIIICVILIPACKITNLFRCSTLVFEAIALLAFGITWLIKGRALGETGNIGKVLYREENAPKEGLLQDDINPLPTP